MKVILLTAIEYVREEEVVTTEENFAQTANKGTSDNEVQGEPKIHVAVLEGVEAWNDEKRKNDVQSGQWICVLRALG